MGNGTSMVFVMDLAYSLTIRTHTTRATGLKTRNMAGDARCSLVALHMKDNSKTVATMALVHSKARIVMSTQVNFKMVRSMGKVKRSPRTHSRSMKENSLETKKEAQVL